MAETKSYNLKKRLTIISGIGILAIFIIVIWVLSMRNSKKEYLHDFLQEFQDNIPEEVSQYAADNYSDYLQLTDINENADHIVTGKAFCIYSYPETKEDRIVYHYPLVLDDQIKSVFSVIYDTKTNTCTGTAGEGIEEWLNTIQYTENDDVLYAIDHNDSAEVIVAEDAYGKKKFENEKLVSILSDNEKKFLSGNLHDKLDTFSKEASYDK